MSGFTLVKLGYTVRDVGTHARDREFHERDRGFHVRDRGFHVRDRGFHACDYGYTVRDHGLRGVGMAVPQVLAGEILEILAGPPFTRPAPGSRGHPPDLHPPRSPRRPRWLSQNPVYNRA